MNLQDLITSELNVQLLEMCLIQAPLVLHNSPSDVDAAQWNYN